MQYAYRDRRNKKREFKSLWIQRINAGVRLEGLTYSRFIYALNKSGIKIDRKILAEIAYDNPEAFKTLVKKVHLITPNIPEAEVLTKIKIESLEDMIHAANILLNFGVKNILIKGGHRKSKVMQDVFLN